MEIFHVVDWFRCGHVFGFWSRGYRYRWFWAVHRILGFFEAQGFEDVGCFLFLWILVLLSIGPPPRWALHVLVGVGCL